MKAKSFRMLLVSLLLCDMIGCGEKPEPVVEKPKPAAEEPEPVGESPKPRIEDLKAVVSEAQKECGEPGKAQPDLAFTKDEAVARQKESSQSLGTPAEITNGIGMKLKLIPEGEFMMGSPDDKRCPRHKVRITKPFYLGVYEVTQAECEKVMGKNPSNFQGADNPVEKVTWEDAAEFCKKLSAKEGRTYRLPTEAEWEYACRAGSTTLYSFGDDQANLGEYAWYLANSDKKTRPAGEKKPNNWGLCDMHGNVWEWCQDWYDLDYYAVSPTGDPPGPETGSLRVYRGGSWDAPAGNCGSSDRYGYVPSYGSIFLGFRVAADPPSQSSQEEAEAVAARKAAMKKAVLIKAISSWASREVNWLDELRDLSIRFPGPRDAVIRHMSMRPSHSGGGVIEIDGLVRDPRIVVEIEQKIRDEYRSLRIPRIQERRLERDSTWHFHASMAVKPRRKDRYVSHLPEEQRHQEQGNPQVSEATVVAEEPIHDNVQQVLQQLARYESQSLPGDWEVARSLYRAWLLELVDDVKLANPTVASGPARKERYHTLPSFSVRGHGTLEQLKIFLFAFYQTDLLHQIRSLSIRPPAQGNQLDLSMSIEALVLDHIAPDGDDGDQQTVVEEFRQRCSRVSNRLASDNLEDYDVIDRRNLFSEVRTGHSDARIPAALDAPPTREPRIPRKDTVSRNRLPKGLPSWFVLRDTDGDAQLTLQEYAPDSSAPDIKEFSRYDGNGDGVLTPQECLQGASSVKLEDKTSDEVETPPAED